MFSASSAAVSFRILVWCGGFADSCEKIGAFFRFPPLWLSDLCLSSSQGQRRALGARAALVFYGILAEMHPFFRETSRNRDS